MKLFKHIVALMLIVTSIALSQETSQPAEQSYEVTLGGGIAFPYIPEEFNNQAQNGTHYTLGGGMLFAPGSSGYSALYLTLGYDRFKANENGLIRAKNKTGSQWKATGGETDLMTAFVEYKGAFSASRRMLAPYFLAGVGVERFKQKDVTVTNGTIELPLEGEHRTTFVWNIGFGFDLPVNSTITLYDECRYMIGIGADTYTQHVVIDGGIRVRF